MLYKEVKYSLNDHNGRQLKILYICIYTYICIYKRKYTHTYIYIHTHIYIYYIHYVRDIIIKAYRALGTVRVKL